MSNRDFGIVAIPRKEFDTEVYRKILNDGTLVRVIVREFTTSLLSKPPEYTYAITDFTDGKLRNTPLNGERFPDFESAKEQGLRVLEEVMLCLPFEYI